MSTILIKAAVLYANAHAPWPWQRKLHAKLAAAYMKGVSDAWALFQADAQSAAQPNVHRLPLPPVPPGEPNVPPPTETFHR